MRRLQNGQEHHPVGVNAGALRSSATSISAVVPEATPHVGRVRRDTPALHNSKIGEQPLYATSLVWRGIAHVEPITSTIAARA